MSRQDRRVCEALLQMPQKDLKQAETVAYEMWLSWVNRLLSVLQTGNSLEATSGAVYVPKGGSPGADGRTVDQLEMDLERGPPPKGKGGGSAVGEWAAAQRGRKVGR